MPQLRQKCQSTTIGTKAHNPFRYVNGKVLDQQHCQPDRANRLHGRNARDAVHAERRGGHALQHRNQPHLEEAGRRTAEGDRLARITAWGRLAEVVKTYMGKGKRVRVIGRLECQSWTDKETGEQRMRAFVVASQVLFLDYDRAHTGLLEEPLAEESAIEEDMQPEAEQPEKSKRSRRKQAA